MRQPPFADQPLLKVVASDDLKAFCISAMIKAGFTRKDAGIVAEVLVTTDTWGIHSHGCKQLRQLIRLCPRHINPRARVEVVAEGPSWATIDGHDAMAILSSHRAMSLAISKAKRTGVAFVGVRNGNHFGAAAYYANMAQKAGMVGLAMCNANPLMTVPGSRGPVLGTNPIGYAVPAGKEPPLLFDIATSVVAGTKILMAKWAGKSIPNTWMVGKDGLPTTDPSGFPKVGALVPMAAHKGYGIALLVEILSAVLPGAAVMSEVGVWTDENPRTINQGHCFIAINAGAIMPLGRFKRRMDAAIREIKSAPKAKGADRIFLPGEMEWENRQRYLRDGIPLPPVVANSLMGLASDLELDLETFFRIARTKHAKRRLPPK